MRKFIEPFLLGIGVGFMIMAIVINITVSFGIAPNGTVAYKSLFDNNITYPSKDYQIYKIKHTAELKVLEMENKNKYF